jgi:ABC-type transport system involved in multi-copper enzyme maturation permease subunit
VLLIFFLGAGSGIASANGIFFSENKNINFLLTLPVDSKQIIRWLFIKAILMNVIFLSVFLLPPLWAYFTTFGGFTVLFIIKSGVVIGMMTLATITIGGIAALWFTKKLKKHKMPLTLFGVGIFFLLFFVMFKLLFPPRLAMLTTATNEQFFQIYNSLPLTSVYIPTNWLAMIITGKMVWPYLLSGLATGLLTIAFMKLTTANFLLIHQEPTENVLAPASDIKNIHFEKYSVTDNIAIKDLLSIIRSPIETGYGIFLLLLMLFFFWLFSKINFSSNMDPEWIKRLVVFSYAGFMFFANTYLLRLVFPLLAKEADSAWFLFTQPVSRGKILWSKLLLGFLTGLPLLLISLLVWWLPGYVSPYQSILAVSSFWTITLLIIIQAFMGMIFPNFAEGSNPEKVSTSSMGIASLVVSTTMTVVFAFGIYGYINNAVNLTSVWITQTVFTVFIFLTLYPAAKNSMKNLEF